MTALPAAPDLAALLSDLRRRASARLGDRPRLRRAVPALIAFAGGIMAAAAHPPYGLLPGVFGYALILFALDGFAAPRPLRSALSRGWAAGAGYMLVSTLWIVEPFLIDVAEHGWQAPFAVVLMAGGLGLLWGAAGLAHRLLAGAAAGGVGACRVLAFAAAFGLWEWLRGHILTGFPWDLPGETFPAGTALSQNAAWAGAYGLSVIVLAVGAAPAVLLGRESLRARLVTLTAATAALALAGGWGAARLARPVPTPPDAPRVRLVQPNLPEPPAWSEAVFRRAVDGYTTLTAAPASRPADLVVWPEGAIPESFNAYLAPGSEAAARIAASLRPGQRLLVGGVRIAPGPGGGFDDGLYFNTLAALRRGEAGLVLEGTYDKHHLVPFGEYMPLARLLGPLGLRKLVSVSADFTPGPRPRPLILPGLSLQPLICYEALFPGIAPSGRGPRPRAIVNISDDAWFGRHAGPWQHFNLASYRAIEEGLPMMRATPTGVTGMIDAYGRSEGRRLAPGAAGVVDARLPAALAPTVYARWRDAPFWLMVLGCAVAVLLARGGRKLAF